MQKTSQLVVSLLLSQGANAISLNKNTAAATVDQDDMTDPKYFTDMTLENWKLFSQSETLQMYRNSLKSISNFEARISEYSMQSVEEEKRIIAAKNKL